MPAHRHSTSALLLLAGVTFGAPGALASPPTDEQIEKAIETFYADYKKAAGDEARIKEAARKAAEGISVDEMTLQQIADARWLLANADLGPKAVAKLNEFAKSDSGEGAAATVIALSFLDADKDSADVQAVAITRALAHPGLDDAMKEGLIPDFFHQIRGASKEAKKLIAPELVRLESLLTPDMPAPALGQIPTLVVTLLDIPEAPQGLAERIRVKAVDLLTAAREKADERTAKRIDNSLAMLNGAMAKGQLMNHAAPAMGVEWSSDPAIKSMADFKGKVVVVDFWATWCGPCIASFPKVRDLQKRYEGYPVAVVGVTSLQGFHMGPAGKVDTKGKPAEEYALMPDFMKQKGITWPVIFTTQNVFNPDYGVQGIPHVAILAPDGTVRFNALHPGQNPEEKYAKIDGLLKEFNLPAPADAAGKSH